MANPLNKLWTLRNECLACQSTTKKPGSVKLVVKASTSIIYKINIRHNSLESPQTPHHGPEKIIQLGWVTSLHHHFTLQLRFSVTVLYFWSITLHSRCRLDNWSFGHSIFQCLNFRPRILLKIDEYPKSSSKPGLPKARFWDNWSSGNLTNWEENSDCVKKKEFHLKF